MAVVKACRSVSDLNLRRDQPLNWTVWFSLVSSIDSNTNLHLANSSKSSFTPSVVEARAMPELLSPKVPTFGFLSTALEESSC